MSLISGLPLCDEIELCYDWIANEANCILPDTVIYSKTIEEPLMKPKGVCPQCGSNRIAEIPSELGTYNAIKVDMFGFAKLRRYICTLCGYMEQYVSDEKSLSKLRRRK